jgi:hypothetical protein
MSFLKIQMKNGEMFYRSNGFPEYSINNCFDSGFGEIKTDEEIKSGECSLIESFHPEIVFHAQFVLMRRNIKPETIGPIFYDKELERLLLEYRTFVPVCCSLAELMEKIDAKYGIVYEP